MYLLKLFSTPVTVSLGEYIVLCLVFLLVALAALCDVALLVLRKAEPKILMGKDE